MKISLVVGAVVLAQQSRACVAVTIKEDLVAGQYNWTVWKDGHREAAFHEKGVRPRTMFGDVNDQDYWVTLDGDFHEMTGHVKKLSYSEFQWNRKYQLLKLHAVALLNLANYAVRKSLYLDRGIRKLWR
ncbi:hypothetical protein ACHAPJ_011843 [Fusarium lateritium]